MPRTSATTPQGTLELLVLKALATGDLHGLGISRRVEQMSGGEFRIPFGTLFPTLHRLESHGWLASRWDTSEANRRAKFYTLTKAGQKRLTREVKAWRDLVAIVGRVIEA